MTQPGSPQQPRWRPPQGQSPFQTRPQPGYNPGQPSVRQPWDHPRPGFPLQQTAVRPGQGWPNPVPSGPYGQPPIQPAAGWQPSPPPRRRSPLPFLSLAVFGLIALLGYSFFSGPDDDQVTAEYQNENYVVPSTGGRVPQIPIPEYESEIASWLQDNTLYEQKLASPVRCDVEPISSPAALSDGALQSRMRGYVECLTRVWGPALEKAGHTAYQPTLFVYPAGGEVTTGCGTQESLNAFYCGADQNLYLAADVLRILPSSEAAASGAYDLIIAHEYGHAMQGRSGVFAASHYASAEAGSESGAMEVSRRVELQADCFAGAAIDSVSESMGLGDTDREKVARISFEIGDDRLAERFHQGFEEGDHGVGENRMLWARRGLSGSPLATCNTFTAPGSEVR